jgi:hypothetical protein
MLRLQMEAQSSQRAGVFQIGYRSVDTDQNCERYVTYRKVAGSRPDEGNDFYQFT